MRKTVSRTVTLGFVAALGLGSAACGQDYQENDQAASPAAESPAAEGNAAGAEPGTAGTSGTTGTVRIADIMEEPARFMNQKVTVVADVEEVFGPRAMALDEDAPAAGGIDNDLLVLGKEAGKLASIDDQWTENRVRVSGTIGKWAVVELEREIGWDLNPELEVELEGAGAVLVADSIERVKE